MFDSKQYEWKDIHVVIAGEDIAGIKEIKYSTKRDKEYNYGRGDKPHSIQHGNLEGSGNIKIFQSELDKLIAKAPNGDITLLSVQAVVTYAPELGAKNTTDRIIGMEFLESPKGMSQGDKMSEHDLPIMFLDIKYNV